MLRTPDAEYRSLHLFCPQSLSGRPTGSHLREMMWLPCASRFVWIVRHAGYAGAVGIGYRQIDFPLVGKTYDSDPISCAVTVSSRGICEILLSIRSVSLNEGIS